MKYTIKKGSHFSVPLFKFFTFRDIIKNNTFTVIFYEDCKYDIGEDQSDINKLYGIGYINGIPFKNKSFKLFGKYISFPWFIPFHHINSVRFGWVYNPLKQDMMEIWAYLYKNKNRQYEYLCDVSINKEYCFKIDLRNNNHILHISEGSLVLCEYAVFIKSSKIGYSLKPFFGGNQKAPHNMTIKLDKLWKN